MIRSPISAPHFTPTTIRSQTTQKKRSLPQDGMLFARMFQLFNQRAAVNLKAFSNFVSFTIGGQQTDWKCK